MLSRSFSKHAIVKLAGDPVLLKATKAIKPEAWDNFGSQWENPWANREMDDVLDDLRGPVELPPRS